MTHQLSQIFSLKFSYGIKAKTLTLALLLLCRHPNINPTSFLDSATARRLGTRRGFSCLRRQALKPFAADSDFVDLTKASNPLIDLAEASKLLADLAEASNLPIDHPQGLLPTHVASSRPCYTFWPHQGSGYSSVACWWPFGAPTDFIKAIYLLYCYLLAFLNVFLTFQWLLPLSTCMIVFN